MYIYMECGNNGVFVVVGRYVHAYVFMEFEGVLACAECMGYVCMYVWLGACSLQVQTLDTCANLIQGEVDPVSALMR